MTTLVRMTSMTKVKSNFSHDVKCTKIFVVLLMNTEILQILNMAIKFSQNILSLICEVTMPHFN